MNCGRTAAEPGVSAERRNSPSSDILMVIKFVGRTADGAPMGTVCMSTVAGGLGGPAMDPDPCEVGSIPGGRLGGLVPMTCGPG